MYVNCKPGDRVTVVYDNSPEGRLPCQVIKNDGARLTLAPDNRPRRCEHYLHACTVTGRVPLGGQLELSPGHG
jgi:hypothetical protein